MADEKTSEGNPSSSISRRGFFGRAGKTIVGAAAAGFGTGFGVGREVEYRQENPDELTTEPWEIQIRKLELRSKPEGLRDEVLRNNYTWLITMWYGRDHSFGAFAAPDDEYAAAEKMYSSTSFITDESDSRLEGYENFAGWTFAQDSILMNLTSAGLREEYTYNSSGGVITPPMQMRDTLVHELTHFITKERKEAAIIDKVKKLKPEFNGINDVTINGFKILFVPNSNDPSVPAIQYLDDFDEASTELIANYYQRTAGLAVGLPSYPEQNQTESDQSRIERALDALEATLKLSGISMDQFAELHAHSDLDGLAKAFADSINKVFQDDTEKIQYGLSIIVALKELDRKAIGEHIQRIRI